MSSFFGPHFVSTCSTGKREPWEPWSALKTCPLSPTDPIKACGPTLSLIFRYVSTVCTGALEQHQDDVGGAIPRTTKCSSVIPAPFLTLLTRTTTISTLCFSFKCINGRMTIGKLLEMLYGALGVTQGEIQDATPFFNVSARWALEELMKEGYNDTYTMVSGTTGEVYAQPWFLGVCFYQRLKHHVLDKVAARARGVLAVLTRQPVDGRANNGGQKFGEMEFDALKAAGAAHVSRVYDRFVRKLK